MMTKQQILRKIGEIIQELNEQHQYLQDTPEISPLELELFTANADFLIDHIEVLKKLSAQGLLEKPVMKQETFKEEQVLQTKSEAGEEDEHQEESQHENDLELPEAGEFEGPKFDFSFDGEPKEMSFDFEKKLPVEQVFDRELSDEEKELIKAKEAQPEVKAADMEEGEKEETEEQGPEPFLIITAKENQQEIIAEKISDESETVKQVPELTVNDEKAKPFTLNEMLSSKFGNRSAGSAIGSKPAIDLKAAINLNDKMVFIKELFNGYNLAYSEAVEIINRFESFEAADNFLLKNYANKNDWEHKQAVVDRFYQYINRRFVK